MTPTTTAAKERGESAADNFVLQKVQPALLGLMDGSVSTLAPLFATAQLTGRPRTAFFVGLAASVGAGISMGLAEALSDDGKVTGRGTPIGRGAITGLATALGGMLHTLPFLISDLSVALHILRSGGNLPSDCVTSPHRDIGTRMKNLCGVPVFLPSGPSTRETVEQVLRDAAQRQSGHQRAHSTL